MGSERGARGGGVGFVGRRRSADRVCAERFRAPSKFFYSLPERGGEVVNLASHASAFTRHTARSLLREVTGGNIRYVGGTGGARRHCGEYL